MERAAVYSGTRNVYSEMLTSAKSLLMHSAVDRIYFLIEDDKFPAWLPDCFTLINVSGQKWFPENGVNYKNRWTYMILLRVAFTKIFPHLDQILSLDIDTIVVRDIGASLWNLPFDNEYFAAASEFRKSREGFTYYNFGVAVHNLKNIRKDRMDDNLIQILNTERFSYVEQDCVNQYCQGRFLKISSIYNHCLFTDPIEGNDVRILHFAAFDKSYRDVDIVKWYTEVGWDQVLSVHEQYMRANI